MIETLTSSIHYLASFFAIISVIVFIHEFGHYYVAKLCGVKIDSFSIGFGPEVYGWTDKSGTRWKISILPLGGYVKMFGDETAASTADNKKLKKLSAAEKKQSFHHKSLWQKAAVVFAGPLANFILAIVILALFALVYGTPQTTSEIGEVMKDSAAEEAGLKAGDIILKLDNQEIEKFEDLRIIASLNPGKKLDITVLRENQEVSTSITPVLAETTDIFGNKVKVGLLGIKSGSVSYKEVGITEALVGAVVQTYNISATTLEAIGQIISGERSSDEISGILRIGQYSGQATEKGFNTVLWFMAVLSINLGLINLFPIPLLDGGHLMFYTIEAIKGQPIGEKVQNFSYRIGFALLIALMAFATINDLKYFDIF